MKFMNNLRSFVRPVRFLLASLICTLLFLTSAIPAEAGNSHQSKPTDGTVQLDEIFEKTEDVANSDPMSLKQVEKRSNQGINEVQGDADKDKMESGDGTAAIVEDFEKAMDKVTKN